MSHCRLAALICFHISAPTGANVPFALAKVLSKNPSCCITRVGWRWLGVLVEPAPPTCPPPSVTPQPKRCRWALQVPPVTSQGCKRMWPGGCSGAREGGPGMLRWTLLPGKGVMLKCIRLRVPVGVPGAPTLSPPPAEDPNQAEDKDSLTQTTLLARSCSFGGLNPSPPPSQGGPVKHGAGGRGLGGGRSLWRVPFIRRVSKRLENPRGERSLPRGSRVRARGGSPPTPTGAGGCR